jgi:5-methylcytosine-specific restriction endonuclease McrA
MLYKSEKQKKALQKQVKFLQEHNKLFNKFQEKKIKDLYKQGLSCNQIAKKFNCSKSPILRIIKDLPKRKATDYKQHPAYNQWGENNPVWKGGIKSVYERIRGLKEYWDWRNAVIRRDNHKCANCGSFDNLEVHHINTLKSLITQYCLDNNIKIKNLEESDLKSAFFYDSKNGVTYCKTCHRNYHKKFGR